MRRRHSRIAFAILFAGFLLAPTSGAPAQSGSAGEGALELLVPTGARAIGMGQAAVAVSRGTDAVWWNPALIGRDDKREAAYFFAQSLFAENDNSVSALFPVPEVGSAAITFRDIDYGQQEVTDEIGPTGLLSTRAIISLATFGAPLGPASIGLSFKFFYLGFNCTGECPNVPSQAATTSAIDVGASYSLHAGPHEVSVGASVVNLGRALQVKDAPQADPLPARMQAGLAIVPTLAGVPDDVTLTAGADVVARISGVGRPGVRLGGEVEWQRTYQLRAGYAVHAATGSGFSLGVGASTGRLQVDLARFMSDIASIAGEPPTYLTLRVRF